MTQDIVPVVGTRLVVAGFIHYLGGLPFWSCRIGTQRDEHG